MALTDFNTKQIKEKLVKIKREEEEEKAKKTAKKFNLPYVNLTITPIDYENLANIPRKKAEQGNIIAIQRKNRVISLALTNLDDSKTKEIIEELKKKGFECKIFIVSPTSLKRGLGYYDIIEQHGKKRSLRSVFIIQKKELEEFKKSLQTVQELEKTINTLPTSRLLTIIMAGAIEMQASDIHIEPSKESIRLRYRIDGLLQDIVNFPIKQYAFLLSKIKMLSDMLLNVHDISQDGRFSINILKDEEIEQEIDLRVSVLPSNKGESIVIRLLGLSAIKLDIKELGV
nr:Flp pilus assembly complex ATPase component TadA [Pelagibacterales bacterium]